jgi:hypothetical protein
MIKKTIIIHSSCDNICWYVNTAHSQSPISGFMQGKGKGNISLQFWKYDKVLLVPQETDGVPVFNEVQINSKNLFATYGVSDQLILYVSTIESEGEVQLHKSIKQSNSNTRKGFKMYLSL